jgi:superfamily II DNA or RNA helicase
MASSRASRRSRGALADRFDRSTFRHPFRRYQQEALDAFDRAQSAGRRRFYVAMPPGSGKTVIGLEAARRLGRPTLILGPNTAIQAQWLAQWGDFVPAAVPASAEPDLSAPITVLTYQAICVLDRTIDDDPAPVGSLERDDDGDAADGAFERRRRRRLIARGGDREQVLGLLHPNGRAIVDRIASAGPFTIVLDECHHLLEMWGHLLGAVLAEIGDDAFIIGLTATPPSDMDGRERALYERLFGDADFEVVTPAVVKEGHLAPYQELAYLTVPLPHELEWIADQQSRFDELLSELRDPAFASRPFRAWLDERVVERRGAGDDGRPTGSIGARVSWSRFEADEPALALAALRLLWSERAAIPRDAHVREQHRQPPMADDWMALLEGYTRDCLEDSLDPVDVAARERIRRALPSVGYRLTRAGIAASVSVTDRVLAFSASKSAAAVEILSTEERVLGDRLRALVLCDHEVAGREVGARLSGVLDPQVGSAALAMHVLLSSTVTAALDPVLVTGRTVACSRATAHSLVGWIASQDGDLGAALQRTDGLVDAAERGPTWEDLVIVRPNAARWRPRIYVPLVTRFFESGGARCLVGTRGLLGEGWDCRAVNVLIDLTTAATATSVHQVRGRGLRLDASWPEKVTDDWDVVCVAPGHAKGAADYARFVRKHRAYFALTAGGEIESGVSHVDPGLSPFGPPPAETFADLDERMLARASDRATVRAAWRIGEPYRDEQMETIRLRAARSLGIPGRRQLRHGPPDWDATRLRWLGAVSVAAGLAVWVTGLVLGGGWIGAVLGVMAGAAGLASVGRSATARLSKLSPSDTLEDLASALAEGLSTTGVIDRRLGPHAVRISSQPDGFYRCSLEGASTADARTFAEAMEELLAPLWDPRAIIERRVAEPPLTLMDTIVLGLRRVVRRGPGGRVVYHAVPSVLATGRARLAAFEAAWSEWVSPGARALTSADPRAQAVLAVRTGDDPFGIEAQMRTVWS